MRVEVSESADWSSWSRRWSWVVQKEGMSTGLGVGAMVWVVLGSGAGLWRGGNFGMEELFLRVHHVVRGAGGGA